MKRQKCGDLFQSSWFFNTRYLSGIMARKKNLRNGKPMIEILTMEKSKENYAV